MKSALKKRLFLIMTLFLFSVCAFGKQVETKQTEPDSKAEVTQKLPKLIDFGAHKCIPCKMMAPILEKLTKEYKGVFDVEFIDVWQPENKKKAERHQIRIIPTQIFFDADGKELYRHEGFFARKDILQKWKELGVGRNKKERND